MKSLFGIYLFILSICLGFFEFFPPSEKFIRSVAQVNDSASVRHVVFDIDWTLFSEFDPKLVNPNPAQVFVVQGKSYYFAPYALELIEFLDQMNVRVSFFSGGEAIRNIELLKSVRLSDGRSLQDIAASILNKEQLTKISEDESLPFTDRYKKDMRLVSRDLNTVVWVDDDRRFILNPSQKRNLLWLGPTYQVLENFDQAKNIDLKYLPPTKEAFELSYYKFLILKEAFREMFYQQETKGISWVDAMNLVQEKLHLESEYFHTYSKSLKNRGFVNRSILKHTGPSCTDVVNGLVKVP